MHCTAWTFLYKLTLEQLIRDSKKTLLLEISSVRPASTSVHLFVSALSSSASLSLTLTVVGPPTAAGGQLHGGGSRRLAGLVSLSSFPGASAD